jgi:hypothetical protein
VVVDQRAEVPFLAFDESSGDVLGIFKS